jgi:hypothetical protein
LPSVAPTAPIGQFFGRHVSDAGARHGKQSIAGPDLAPDWLAMQLKNIRIANRLSNSVSAVFTLLGPM